MNADGNIPSADTPYVVESVGAEEAICQTFSGGHPYARELIFPNVIQQMLDFFYEVGGKPQGC